MLAASGVGEVMVNVDGPYGMPLEVKGFYGTSGVFERGSMLVFVFFCVRCGRFLILFVLQ